jgi:ubiquitin carboxyl-terminal hydrolase 10
MCFANAVLQLLVYSPPLQNLFRQLGDLKRQHGRAPDPSGCATPLVDAMIRFFKEFMFEEKELPPTQQPLQQTAEGTPREGGVEKKYNKTVDSFEPTYLYEAMKEKSQLNHLLVRTYYPCALLS